MVKRGENLSKKRVFNLILIFLIFFFAFTLFKSCTSIFSSPTISGNIAVIPIKGLITVEGTSSFGETITSSTNIIEFIEEAEKDNTIQAILFEINSPGGSVVATKEIADAIKRVNKPTYSLIRELGASGGYWIASETDKIIASEFSITGSIGVISSYIELAGLLEKYNLTYQRLVAGKYKDIGSPLKTLEQDERTILLIKLNKIHDYFINIVSENRNLSKQEVTRLATGEFFLGLEAYEYGLVDVLGDMKTAEEIIKQEVGLEKIDFARYETSKTFFESLAGVFSENSFFVGKGIGTALKESKISNKLTIMT